MIAALYVDPRGPYFGRDDIDPWDEARDARLYPDPWPVVAHPPCSTWCQLASVNHARWGSPIGQDGGCFAAALEAVRAFGGVLEHPAYSLAWSTFELPRPSPFGWRQALTDDGWVAEVSQVAYGHEARKRTWLYYVGDWPPAELDWSEPQAAGVVGAGIHSGECVGRPRLGRAAAIHTPTAFQDALIGLARGARAVPLLASRQRERAFVHGSPGGLAAPTPRPSSSQARSRVGRCTDIDGRSGVVVSS